MLSPQKLLALLLIFFAATALAHDKYPRRVRPGLPWKGCIIKPGDPRELYTIIGRNWNVTETQFKTAINTPGTVLTAWEWELTLDIDKVECFKAKVRFHNGSFSLVPRLWQFSLPAVECRSGKC